MMPGYHEIDASVLEALPPEIREEAGGNCRKSSTSQVADCAFQASAGSRSFRS